jgi:glycosyltransferase involved in cell wall biosynthesis
VLLVVHQFFPNFTAGTEVLTWGVARELRSRGHTVRIVAGHPGRDELRESERWVRDEFDGFEVDRFHHAYVPMQGQRSMIEVGSDNVLAARHFAGILAQFLPDRVHYFHLNRLGTGLILVAEAAGAHQSFTPTDFWAICTTAQLRLPDGQLCHGPSLHAGNCIKHFAQNPARAAGVRFVARAMPTAWADALAPLARTQAAARLPFAAEVRALGERLPKTVSRLNRLQCILAPNAFMRAKLLEYGVRPERVVESAFGVDLPTIAPTREGRRPADGQLRVGFIGTLGPHKGAHVLLSAFALLPRGACSLRIHGNPADFPDYVQELSALAAGLEDIVFAGTFPNHAIFDVMADLDVLVVPSLWYENTPLVVYSAQAAGTIVVASDHPGIAAVVRHEVDGLLFPSGDSAALAQQLRRLAADRKLLARLAANVRPPRSTSDYVDDLLRFWGAP